MSLTRREWNAVVLLGCLAGTGIACGFWVLVLALAELNRTEPGAGWALAALLVFAPVLAVWKMRQNMKPRTHANKHERGTPCE